LSPFLSNVSGLQHFKSFPLGQPINQFGGQTANHFLGLEHPLSASRGHLFQKKL